MIDATAIIYGLKNKKSRKKTYLIRKIFGYKDFSNKGKYTYERQGILSKYIVQKWGKSVIIILRSKERIVARILNEHSVEHKKVRIKLEQK